MPRPRKKHIQQAFEFRTHGGKRTGAGRPRKSGRPREPHGKRPEINPRYPLHLTTRVLPDLGSLRKRDIFVAIRAATIVVFQHPGFRLIHASIQSSHLHLIAEGDSKETLSAGVQVFLSCAAKRINAAISRRSGRRRRGKVFDDRYHTEVMTNPRAVRHTLSYVLNNWRRHGEDRAWFAVNWKVDPYSSGLYFTDWAELGDAPWAYRPRQGYFGLMTWLPKTWLLRVGWKLTGTISNRETPGRA